MNTQPLQNTTKLHDATNRQPPPITARLKRNFPQKIIALVCSVILSIVVMSDRNLTVEFQQIPVNIVLPDGFTSTDDIQQPTVTVRVSGRASRLRGISRDDLGTLTISPPPREGNIQMTLQPSMISLPDGAHIEKFQPEFIGINLEPLETRTLAVSTVHAFTGEPLPGFQLGEVRITPPEIEVTGPRSVISNTSQLYIEPIDLTGKASTFTVNRWIILNRNGLKAASERVEVTVNIVSQSKQHIVIGVPIVPINLNAPHTFKPATIDLTLIGDEASLSKIDTSNLFITVDAAQENDGNEHTRILNHDDFSVPNLPSGVAIDESKLPSVLLTVPKTSSDTPKHPQ